MTEIILKRTELVDKIIDQESYDQVKLLTGIRGVGKSILLKQIMDELKMRGVNEDNLIFISFFSQHYRNKDLWELYKLIKDKIHDESKYYLFFDDIEEFPKWQSLLNYLRVDSNCEIYAAVNYSKFFSREEKAELAGRSFKFEIFPFSFKEFLNYHMEFEDDIPINDLFMDYIRFGGMPELLQLEYSNEKLSVLEQIFKIILYQDFVKGSDMDEFLVKTFLEFMVENFTEKFSYKKAIKALYDEEHYELINNCLYIMPNSSLMFKSNIANSSNRKISFDEKYYLADHGLYNAVYRNDNYIIEKLLKNIVFIELLRRGYRVFFMKDNKKTIDFVCSDFNRKIVIQFDYVFLNPDITQKEIESLNSQNFTDEKYIITTGNYDFSQFGVKHLNIIDFLLCDEI